MDKVNLYPNSLNVPKAQLITLIRELQKENSKLWERLAECNSEMSNIAMDTKCAEDHISDLYERYPIIKKEELLDNLIAQIKQYYLKTPSESNVVSLDLGLFDKSVKVD
jgi:predicted nuclease with TOPRIM domain